MNDFNFQRLCRGKKRLKRFCLNNYNHSWSNQENDCSHQDYGLWAKTCHVLLLNVGGLDSWSYEKRSIIVTRIKRFAENSKLTLLGRPGLRKSGCLNSRIFFAFASTVQKRKNSFFLLPRVLFKPHCPGSIKRALRPRRSFLLSVFENDSIRILVKIGRISALQDEKWKNSD